MGYDQWAWDRIGTSSLVMGMFERLHSSQSTPLMVFDGEILHEYQECSKSMLCVGDEGSRTAQEGQWRGLCDEDGRYWTKRTDNLFKAQDPDPIEIWNDMIE